MLRLLAVLSALGMVVVLSGCGALESEVGGPVAVVAKVTPPETLRILYTCDTRGHVDPCNCSAGVAGGVARRMTYIADNKSSHYLLVDAGNVTQGPREWELLQLEYILKSYAVMGYHAVNLGHREVSIGVEGLRRYAAQFPAFVSANVLDASGEPVVQPYRIVTLDGGYRVGILGVADDSLLPDEIGEGLQLIPPREAIAKYLAEVKSKSDFIMVLAFADEEAMKALAQEFFEIDVIVGGKVKQPSGEPATENQSVLAYITDKGKSIGMMDLAIVDGQGVVIHNEITMLLEQFEDHPEVAELVKQLKLEEVERNFVGMQQDDEEGLSAL